MDPVQIPTAAIMVDSESVTSVAVIRTNQQFRILEQAVFVFEAISFRWSNKQVRNVFLNMLEVSCAILREGIF